MQDSRIVTELEEGILSVRFNRPEKKNAIDLAMYEALVAALAMADGEEAVRVVLFSGTGGDFTSGNDLGDFRRWPEMGAGSPALRFIKALSLARKPLVAAVEGSAVGIGVTMLLHCDLVYSGEGARFQLPFVNLGLCPEGASSILLPQLVGRQRAAELLLLGESFSARRSEELGMVNAVYPDGQVLEGARFNAKKLAAQPAAALRLAKGLLKRDYAAALAEAIEAEARTFMERLGSPETAEALEAFSQRRKPDFSRFS